MTLASTHRLISIFLFSVSNLLGQEDTIRRPISQSFFKVFTGSINAIYNNGSANGSFDLSVQTYHYYFITGKRKPLDSTRIKRKPKTKSIYKGIHFYVLNRAAIDLDTLQSIANNYITSLQSSPLTFRLNKEFFLTKNRTINDSIHTPIHSIICTGDGRAVPFGNNNGIIRLGASAHFFLTFSSLIKRLEYNSKGKQIDHGIMYFKPTVGIAYGTHGLFTSLIKGRKSIPIISTECRIGFKSEKKSIRDFSFLLRYTLTEINGPKLRAGIILSSID